MLDEYKKNLKLHKEKLIMVLFLFHLHQCEWDLYSFVFRLIEQNISLI